MIELDTAWRRRREQPLEVGADVVGYLGLDTPVELIAAAGLRPVRVLAQPRSAGAEPFAEGLGNPALRAIASAIIEGPYRGISKLVISPTPAAYGWLYNFLRELKESGEGPAELDVYLFDLNHGRAAGLDQVRRRAVMGLKDRLESWAGRFIDAHEAIATENRTRGLLRQVEALRGERKLGAVEALAVFGAREAMAPADYQAALEKLLAGRARHTGFPGALTVFSGAETFGPDAYLSLVSNGRLVVADDQDAGSRSIGPDVDETAEPLGALAERYAARDPAPAKWGLTDRTAYLLGLVKAAKATGVVFDLPPHDHPAAWEAPALRKALAAAGIDSEVLQHG